ncbi:alkaline phosphatase-like [Amphiura filiformis]|uniref:alkaline phosphatase-like n=1 Tax=Amphiura filiformis TaxID=82378 RepID=UPI003B21FCCB
MDIKLVLGLVVVVAVVCAIPYVQSQEIRCANRCFAEVEESLPCQCNRACQKYGNCCEDFELQCLVEHWKKYGRDELQKALKKQELNKNLAKNVIIFIGDGMDLTTVTAARILKGQQKGLAGEEEKIVWETFPYTGLLKTYATDRQIPDSAATATALFCGVKTKSSTIGVDDRIEVENCATQEGASVDSVMVDAQEMGKSTGIVTNSYVSDATPGAMYAHSAYRRWLSGPVDGCEDVTSQIISKADKVNVIMGGGRAFMLPNTTADPEDPDSLGTRTDGRNLIEEWTALHEGHNSQYVWKDEDLTAVDIDETDYLLGLFAYYRTTYENDRTPETRDPSLAEMTTKAIEILQKNKNGFLLMVEGALIDIAHHFGIGQDALNETIALDEAVSAALDMVNLDETLVIVTADHSHGMSMSSGYSSRGNPILGLNDQAIGNDKLPYTTLLYNQGPGGVEELDSIKETGHRRNLTNEETMASGFHQSSLIPSSYATHGGVDIPVYAIGPMAHMLDSTHEQNYVAHVIRHAACMGEYADDCSRFPTRRNKARKRPASANIGY